MLKPRWLYRMLGNRLHNRPASGSKVALHDHLLGAQTAPACLLMAVVHVDYLPHVRSFLRFEPNNSKHPHRHWPTRCPGRAHQATTTGPKRGSVARTHAPDPAGILRLSIGNCILRSSTSMNESVVRPTGLSGHRDQMRTGPTADRFRLTFSLGTRPPPSFMGGPHLPLPVRASRPLRAPCAQSG